MYSKSMIQSISLPFPVLLDRHPTDDHDQWLVAATVGTNQSGNALVLRATSALPNHYGLGSLLTMIFAPAVEMLCDKKRKRYTGFLCGLGHRDRDWGRGARTGQKDDITSGRTMKVSYAGEHDMEVRFDVHVDNDDVYLINKVIIFHRFFFVILMRECCLQIRYTINKALLRETFGGANPRKMTLEDQKQEGFLTIANAKKLHETQASSRFVV